MANDLIEKESISVVVRCRGRNTRETDSKSPIIVDVPSITGSDQVSINTSGDFSLASKISSTRTYKVDQVYGPGADQQTFFDGVASPLFEEFLKGYNCTIFAYGQTGTGKTYTMCGDLGGNDFIRSTVTSQENSSVELKDPIGNNKTISDIKNIINNNSNKNIENKINNFEISTDAGLVPRILCKLFENLNILRDDWSVKCSFVEIYNEELKDLLADPTTSRSSKLRIFEKKKPNSITNSIKIDGLEEMYISNVDQGLSLLKQGIECRKTASTKLNDYSSRSHTIFTITLLKKNINNEYQISKLNLVDLAGSENILRSGAVNQRAKEAGSINQSLLTLGRIVKLHLVL
ncbi:binding protein [[Candida] boidinii]|nr:binding protein [[Candida] boidinii]